MKRSLSAVLFAVVLGTAALAIPAQARIGEVILRSGQSFVADVQPDPDGGIIVLLPTGPLYFDKSDLRTINYEFGKRPTGGKELLIQVDGRPKIIIPAVGSPGYFKGWLNRSARKYQVNSDLIRAVVQMEYQLYPREAQAKIRAPITTVCVSTLPAQSPIPNPPLSGNALLHVTLALATDNLQRALTAYQEGPYALNAQALNPPVTRGSPEYFARVLATYQQIQSIPAPNPIFVGFLSNPPPPPPPAAAAAPAKPKSWIDRLFE